MKKKFMVFSLLFACMVLQHSCKKDIETKITEIELIKWQNNSVRNIFVQLEIQNNTSDTLYFLNQIENENNRYDINCFEYTFELDYRRNRYSANITLITKENCKIIKPKNKISFWISFDIPYEYYNDPECADYIPGSVSDSLKNLKLRYCPVVRDTEFKYPDTLYFETDSSTIINIYTPTESSC